MKIVIKKIKILALSFLFFFFSFCIANKVYAESAVSFSAASIDIETGQSFNLGITVDPQGVKNYGVKMVISFPADLLEVKFFVFDSNWKAISYPKYESVDNENGVLIKTGIYYRGFLSPVTFGTISFIAKKEGSGTIKINNDSLILDVDHNNVLTNNLIETSVNIKKSASDVWAENSVLNSEQEPEVVLEPQINNEVVTTSKENIELLNTSGVEPTVLGATEFNHKAVFKIKMIIGLILEIIVVLAIFVFLLKFSKK